MKFPVNCSFNSTIEIFSKLWNFISLFYIFSSFVFPTAHQIVKQSFSEYSSHGFWVVLTLTFVGETRAKQQSGEGRWTWLVLASQAQIILRAYVIFTFEFWVGGVAVLSSPNISQDLTTLRQKGNFCTKNYNCTIMLTFLARKLQYLGMFTIQLFWTQNEICHSVSLKFYE